MTTSGPPSYEPRWYDGLLPLLGVCYCLLVILVLTFIPMLVSRGGAPWIGFVLSALALPIWGWIGPPPMPGLLNGALCINGYMMLFSCSVIALIRALYWTFAG